MSSAEDQSGRRPYSLEQAAAKIGMSRYWLRDRLETPELRNIAFRTSGDTGHWRLRAAPYDRYAARFNSGRTAPLERAPRPRKRRPAPRASSSNLMQIYRESKA